MDSKGEVLLTIMASLAQQESQSLSQNVKMGIQYTQATAGGEGIPADEFFSSLREEILQSYV